MMALLLVTPQLENLIFEERFINLNNISLAMINLARLSWFEIDYFFVAMHINYEIFSSTACPPFNADAELIKEFGFDWGFNI